MGRPKVALILTDDERTRLDSLAHRSRSAPAVARRARIILACAEGTDSKAVARRLHVTPGTVCKWRGRFITDRLDGLYDEPRPGAKRTITDEQVEAVIIRTLETTPRGATHWSTREMAKAVGLSHTAISRIWRAFALQPHRSETFKRSNDPQLVEKVRDIVGLSSAREALELIANRRFDVLLADLRMPDGDGYELIRTLRAGEDAHGSTRLGAIAVTANAAPSDRERAIALGYDSHVANRSTLKN
jgi:CheY-like chemotaxis protein